MKVKVIAVAMGLSLAVSVARANFLILAIGENGENFNDLIVTFNGKPLSDINISGTADSWTIDFPPAEFSFSVFRVLVAEPEMTPRSHHVNLVVSTKTSITWISEPLNPTGQIYPSTVTLRDAATFSFFGVPLPCDVVLADSALEGSEVPDYGTTAMLLGTAFTGLGFTRRFWSR